MDDDKDFSFCQLNSQVDLDQPGSPKAMPKIHDVIIKDDFLNGAGIDESMANSFASSIKFSPDDASLASCNVIIPKVGDVQPINDSSDNAGVDGSLSLKVVNMPPPKLKSSGALELSISGRTEDSANGSAAEPKIVKKKPPVRAKVPFEKGYSQMDWLKLTQTHPDLAGLKGNTNRRLISIDEVKQHKNEGSVWTVLKGRVYNITPYMKFHPGGVDMLMKAAGKDCTSLFNKYHAWVNAEFLLEKCLVGALDADR